MYIKDISISNFKSIASAEIDFSRLTIFNKEYYKINLFPGRARKIWSTEIIQ